MAPLDPAIADYERRWKESGIPGLYEGSGPEMRERARCIRALLYPKPQLPAGRIEALTLPGPAGALDCRVIWPRDREAGQVVATLVYYHGGGFIVGDLDSHEAHCIRIANATGAVVVNVGYRLAPESPFPAGIEDAWAALRWVHAHRERFAGKDRPLAVGGDSAGGNFAAVMALQARDAGIELAAQFLLYPATDLRKDESVVAALYLGAQRASAALDLRASPAAAPSLAGIAPVVLGVGVHDFLYKDNQAYVAALRVAGVPLILREFDHLNHGFFSYTAISKPCEIAAELLCADLKGLLTG